MLLLVTLRKCDQTNYTLDFAQAANNTPVHDRLNLHSPILVKYLAHDS